MGFLKIKEKKKYLNCYFSSVSANIITLKLSNQWLWALLILTISFLTVNITALHFFPWLVEQRHLVLRPVVLCWQNLYPATWSILPPLAEVVTWIPVKKNSFSKVTLYTSSLFLYHLELRANYCLSQHQCWPQLFLKKVCFSLL